MPKMLRPSASSGIGWSCTTMLLRAAEFAAHVPAGSRDVRRSALPRRTWARVLDNLIAPDSKSIRGERTKSSKNMTLLGACYHWLPGSAW